MRVKMKVGISGSRNGVDWPPLGEAVDLPDDEAAEMCANGMAEPVKAESKVEKATPEDKSEKATVDAPLTTAADSAGATTPVKRGPGRPRKNP